MTPGKPTPVSRTRTGLAAAFLAIAAVAAGMLVVKHFGASIPGCGPRSACESLEATRWGKVPLVGWPVSFLGMAYFPAMLVGWLIAAGRVPRGFIWLARAGVAASIGFVIVMLVLREICPYCLATHLSNVSFLLTLGWNRRLRFKERDSKEGSENKMKRAAEENAVSRVWKRSTAFAGSTFLVVSLVLGVTDARVRGARRAAAESERRASSELIAAQTLNAATAQPVDRWGAAGFTGRYRLGPEASPIRIVMLTDYQCPDCRRIEKEADDLLKSHKDMTLSIKHFPMCTEAAPGVPCNRYAPKNLHPNACWAARAAETAGILQGDEGFFKMHRWLFNRAGSFTDAELKAGLAEIGFDPQAFMPVMMSQETLRRVQDDVEEGIALGLYYTPMIFINGVEMKGWQTPNALIRTVEEVAAKNPPARTAAVDRPVLASQKYVEDWRDQPVRTIPPDQKAWTFSPTGTQTAKSQGSVQVVVFGDYQETNTALLDASIRKIATEQPNVNYTFRHFPVNKGCNAYLPEKVPAASLHPLACLAAKAAEAAGALGGPSGYWKMHVWLMEHQKDLSEATLRAAAASMSLEATALLAEMERPGVTSAIADDASAGKQLGLTAVPTVIVNRKSVPRPMREGDNVIERIIEEAGKGSMR